MILEAPLALAIILEVPLALAIFLEVPLALTIILAIPMVAFIVSMILLSRTLLLSYYTHSVNLILPIYQI